MTASQAEAVAVASAEYPVTGQIFVDLDSVSSTAKLDTLVRSTQMVPSLGLSQYGCEQAGGNRNVNNVVA